MWNPIYNKIVHEGEYIQIKIILLHYNVLHSQTEFDPSYRLNMALPLIRYSEIGLGKDLLTFFKKGLINHYSV